MKRVALQAIAISLLAISVSMLWFEHRKLEKIVSDIWDIQQKTLPTKSNQNELLTLSEEWVCDETHKEKDFFHTYETTRCKTDSGHEIYITIRK